jgi:phage shock protein PspC (stress-responsive transcriptional regulator)
MQKVVSINLNGHAYQLEESGYEALREYLERAERELENNPDRAEIMADLEQAIAEKCQKFLGPNKSVVSAGEVEEIVKEMGPVEASAGDHANGNGDSGAGRKDKNRAQAAPVKRLYRITDGAMIAGVCNGLAAYFEIDVTIVRIAFVVAAVLTKGVGIMAYLIMMFAVPEANTPEERAAAGGAPFNAKEVIDQAKKHYAEGSRRFRRHWRQRSREWRRGGWPLGPPIVPVPPPLWASALLPVFGLVHTALFLIMAAMMVSLVNTGAILTWRLPADVPLWAGALILLIAYQIIVSPVRAVQQWSWPPGAAAQPALFAFWNAVVWLIGLAFVLWIASDHVPEIRDFVVRTPELIRDFAQALRDLVRE